MDHTPPRDSNVFGCPYFDELRLEQMEYINYILLENLRLATERSELENMYNATNMQYSTLNSEIHGLEMALGVMQKKSMEMASEWRKDLQAMVATIEELRTGYMAKNTTIVPSQKPPMQ